MLDGGHSSPRILPAARSLSFAIASASFRSSPGRVASKTSQAVQGACHPARRSAAGRGSARATGALCSRNLVRHLRQGPGRPREERSSAAARDDPLRRRRPSPPRIPGASQDAADTTDINCSSSSSSALLWSDSPPATGSSEPLEFLPLRLDSGPRARFLTGRQLPVTVPKREGSRTTVNARPPPLRTNWASHPPAYRTSRGWPKHASVPCVASSEGFPEAGSVCRDSVRRGSGVPTTSTRPIRRRSSRKKNSHSVAESVDSTGRPPTLCRRGRGGAVTREDTCGLD